MAKKNDSGVPEDIEWEDGTSGFDVPEDIEWDDGTVGWRLNGNGTLSPVAPESTEPLSLDDVLGRLRSQWSLDDGESTPLPVPPTEPIAPVEVGAGETFINRAANNIPLGRPAVDMATAAQLAAAPRLGRLLPDSLARRLPGVVAGPGAVLTPQARAELAAMGEEVPQEPNPDAAPGLVDTYRGARDLRAARDELGALQNPTEAALGTIAGIGLSAMAPIPGVKSGAPASAGTLRRVLSGARAGALTGAASGAVAGLTDGQADLTRPSLATARQAAGEVLTGALTGGGLGAAVGAAVPAGQALYRGVVKPTAAAMYLRAKGVPLTTGQLNPHSSVAQVEEAMTSTPIVGPMIKDLRSNASEKWQDVVLDEARPPGMGRLDPELDAAERLSKMYKDFNAAYAPAKGLRVEPRTSAGVPLLDRGPRPPAPPLPVPANAQQPPAPNAPPQGTLPGIPRAPAPAGTGDFKLGKDGKWRDPRGRFVPMEKLPPDLRPPAAPKSPDAPEFGPAEGTPAFERVVDDQSVAASDESRNTARKFLQNQLTVLSDGVTDGAVSSDRLIHMRSNLREEIRSQRSEGSKEVARLLTRAEQELTDVIEGGLTPEARDAVRAADRQYAKYKTVERAVASAGDMPDGFTPAQLSRAFRYGKDIGEYARGDGRGGGEIRSLAAAGRKVLDSRFPVTGARLLANFPGASMFAGWANLPGPQRFLTGQTGFQQGAQRAEEVMSRALRRAPVEAYARNQLGPEVEQDMSLEDEESPDMRRQRALAEAIRRMQGGRR